MVIIKQIEHPDYINGINQLAFKISQQENRIFCFSSLNDLEGKTTTVHHTAKALVMMHKKVCVVDVDMIHEKEETTQNTLDAYLENKTNLEKTVCSDDSYDYIVAAKNNSSTSLLSSTNFKDLLQLLLERYDFVLLDAPSLEPQVDAMMVAKISDLLILVIEEGRSSKKQLEHLLLSLKRNNITIFGSVLNKVSEKQL